MNGVGMKNSVNDFFTVIFFHHATDFRHDFSSVLLYGCQNCKVRNSEDIISGQPAKTVWQIMQMRALERALSRVLFHYSVSKSDDNH